MADKQLLKEAIAEAKTIKEVAIANAKAALEETFSPVLKEKLAAMMEEDEKMEEADTMEEAKDEMEEGKDMDETYSYQEEGMDEEKDMDEASLEELLAELEEEMDEAKDMDEAKEMDEEKDMDEAKEMDEAEGDMDLEEMSEDELKSFVEEVIEDMVQAGELEAGGDPVEMSDEEEEGKEEMEMDSMDEEVNIDELLSEEKDKMEEGDMDEGIKDTLKKVYNDPEVMGKIITVDGKKVSLKDLLAMAGGATAGSMAGGGKPTTKTPGSGAVEEEMDEMKKELDELKGELSEVNLLNAKLLYTNKLFRSRSLTESQKVKVLSTFDKAASVKEVKLVFETLSDSLTTSQVVKENKGSASRPTGGASKNPQPILESNDQVRRWQKLAGIITDKSYT